METREVLRHHPLHHWNHGCRCERCSDINRVYEAMKKRGRKGLWLHHAGILETRYPEAVLDWIRARGRFG
jgi:hypothetical protein